MTTDPYDQETDRTFDQITRQLRTPISPAPARHHGGRAMNQPPRTSRDQATLLLGCGGFLLLTALAVAVIIVAWRL